MSVSLTTTPPAIAFSGDQIRAIFTLGDIYQVPGVYAVNIIPIPTSFAVGYIYTFKYGGKEVIMTAVSGPDDSGEQFQIRNPSVQYPNEDFIEYFRSNYTLRTDFLITLQGSNMILTAKNQGLAYNITGFNTTSGVLAELRPNLSVRFILYIENAANDGFEEIYNSPLTLRSGANYTAEAIINDKLHTHIYKEIRENMPDIPGSDPLICKKSCRRYYFEYAESYGEVEKIRRIHKSELFTVLHGGLSTVGQGSTNVPDLISSGSLRRFLKQGGTIGSTRTNQLQYLYFYNNGSSFTGVLKCRLRYTDGTKEVINLYTLELQERRKYAFSVDYSSVFVPVEFQDKSLLAYDIWLSDNENIKKSIEQTYVLDYRPLEFIRYFMNWSSWGTFDSRMFYGKGSLEFDMVQSEALKSQKSPSQLWKGNALVFDIKLTSKFTVTTGFIQNRSLLLFNRDFFLSPLKYRALYDQLLPLKVTSKTIPELEDENNLLAQKFEYEYLFDDQAYTEGDIQEPGLFYGNLKVPYTDVYLTDKEKVFIVTPQNEFITIEL